MRLLYCLLRREIGDLGVTVINGVSSEEEGEWGKKGRSDGQSFIKRGITDKGVQEGEIDNKLQLTDKEGPREQKKRGTVVATGEEE